MFNRTIKNLLPALFCAVIFAACSDSDERGFDPNHVDATGNVLIVCQGNQGVKLPGTVDLYNASQDSLFADLFRSVNGADLGFTPQNAVALGQRIYTAVFDENLVVVTDKRTLALADALHTPQPQCVAADETYLYIAGNDGFVTRFDPARRDTVRLAVGPNPAGLAVSGDYLYVSISDGYNYANNYVNGLRVRRINRKSFKADMDIQVGLNPGQVVAAPDGGVYVVCNGNYADVLPKVWKIRSNGHAAPFCDGSMVCAGPDAVYVVNSVTDWTDWQNPKTTTDCAAYTPDGVKKDGFALSEIPPQPVAIALSPMYDRLYVTSDRAVGDFTSPGWLYVFLADGTLLSRKQTGVHPYALLFVEP